MIPLAVDVVGGLPFAGAVLVLLGLSHKARRDRRSERERARLRRSMSASGRDRDWDWPQRTHMCRCVIVPPEDTPYQRESDELQEDIEAELRYGW